MTTKPKNDFCLVVPRIVKNTSLAASLSKLCEDVVYVDVFLFPNGEVGCNLDKVKINAKSVKILSVDLFNNINSSIIATCIICDALKRKFDIDRIDAIIPYMPYLRQDRVAAGSSAIGARVLCEILSSSGVSSIFTIDAHFVQLQGFFNGKIVDLATNDLFIQDIKKRLSNYSIVAPDVGCAKRALLLSSALNLKTFSTIIKERTSIGESKALDLFGDISGTNCIVVDDIIDGGNTLIKAAKLLMDRGALSVHAYITHPVLSSPHNIKAALNERIINSLTITNTIEHSNDNWRCLDVAQLLYYALKK